MGGEHKRQEGDMIEEGLKKKLQQLGEGEVHLIVRTREDPSLYTSKLEAMGLEVKRSFGLMKAVAVKGKAADALKLEAEPWVELVEEDKTVTIF